MKLKHYIGLSTLITISMCGLLSATHLVSEISENSGNVGFIGVDIAPTIIDVTLPMNYAFIIGPNGDISANFQFINNTFTEVDIFLTGVTNGEYTTTEIVEPTRFSDRQWAELNMINTHRYIALGLEHTLTKEQFWLHQEMPFLLTSIAPRDSETFTWMSKHGNSWASNVVLEYKLYLTVHLR